MSDSRGRIEVVLGTGWRLYQMRELPGWEMLGVVHRGVLAGALARSRTGQYVQMNAGAVRSLDQRKVLSALASAGAPPANS